MDFISLLSLGILLGAQHALEPDHVAAVMTLLDKEKGIGRSAALGVSWGLGHSASLGLVSVLLLVFKISLPAGFGLIFESLVGVLLIVLGLGVLRRVRRERLHAHEHAHEDGRRHVHIHAHHQAHEDHGHRHHHWRSFAIGGVHGLAGSGAVVVLAAGSASSLFAGLGFVGAVGLGLMIGMAGVTVAFGYSLKLAGRVENLYRLLTWATGLLSMAIGVFLLVQLWLA